MASQQTPDYFNTPDFDADNNQYFNFPYESTQTTTVTEVSAPLEINETVESRYERKYDALLQSYNHIAQVNKCYKAQNLQCVTFRAITVYEIVYIM